MSKKLLLILAATLVLIGIAASVILYSIFTNDTSEDTNAPTSSLNEPDETIKVIAQNLDSPWSVAFFGEVALVSSRNTGQVHEILSDGTTRVIGTIEESSHRGEGGLLGLAVQDAKLYAYYTTASDNRIARFSLEGESGNMSMGEPEIIVDGIPAANFHNGGRIAFGPDGKLYATTGDAGDTTAAQDRSKLHGKILRMEPDGSVPEDNPFDNSLVYSYGHRNPQGIAWGEDGTMYASEFGQNTWDELNVIEAGANYGWPEVEGIEERDGFVAPVQQWQPSEASPSGIAYANGTIFIANLRGSLLRTVSTDSLDTSRTYFSDEYGRIRDAVIAPDGRLWIITNNTDGRGNPGDNDDRILSIDLDSL